MKVGGVKSTLLAQKVVFLPNYVTVGVDFKSKRERHISIHILPVQQQHKRRLLVNAMAVAYIGRVARLLVFPIYIHGIRQGLRLLLHYYYTPTKYYTVILLFSLLLRL